MYTITLTATVDEKRRIMIDLPEEVPLGKIELTIRPLVDAEAIDEQYELGSRDWVRAKLKAAGLLAPDEDFPELEGFEELSDEEEERLGRLLAGDRPVEDYINEDREERF